MANPVCYFDITGMYLMHVLSCLFTFFCRSTADGAPLGRYETKR